MKIGLKIFLLSLAAGLFVWLADAAIGYLVFHEGAFLNLLILDVPAHGLYLRFIALAGFIVFGLITAGLFANRRPADKMPPQTEYWLRAILEYSRDGINICKVDYKANKRELVMCNDRFVEMSGRSREELMAAEDLDDMVRVVQIPPDPYERWEKNLPCQGICSWIRPDGKENYYEWTANSLMLGGELYIIGIDRDITERRKADEVLIRSKDWFRVVMEHSHDGINICKYNFKTKKHTLVMCNDRYVEMSGRSREGLLAAENINDFTIGKEHPWNVIERIRSGLPSQGISSWTRPDEKENYYEWNAVGIPVGDEELYIVGIDRDITERMKLEERLRQSENKYRHLFEELADAAFLADAETGLIIETNAAAEGLLGRSRGELVGMPQTALHPPGEADKYRRIFAEDIEKDHYTETEAEVVRKDGAVLPVQIKASTMTIGGRRLILGLFRDVSQHKQVAEELVHSEHWLQVIMKHSRDGIDICKLDPKTNKRALVMCNDRFVEMSGRSREELLAAEDLNDLARNVQSPPDAYERQEKDLPHQGISSWIRPDGKENYYEWNAAGLNIGGERYIIGIDRDVTAQRKQNEVLIRNKDWFRVVMERSRDGINICKYDFKTKKHTLVMCNDRYVEMSGRSREELMATENLDDLTIGIEHPRNPIERLRNGLPSQGISSWIRPDGKENYYEWTAAGLTVGDEELYIVGIDRDITERMKAEEKLKQYQLMVESAHDAIFLKDLNSRYIFANSKALEAFGLPSEQVIGKNDHEIMPDKKEARKNIEDDRLVFKTGKPRETTKHMTGADGKEHWFQAIKVPQLDDKGNVIGLVGIARDITERRQVAEELARSEHWLQVIMKHSYDGINACKFDLKTQKRTLVTCNDRYVEMSGRSREELLAVENLNDISKAVQIPPDFVDRIHSGLPCNGMSCWIRPDGKENYYEWTAAGFTVGDDLYIIGIDRDITERRRMEERLSQVAKMEAIGQMAGGIAHDFNNQLTVIRGYCDLLLRQLTAEDASEKPVKEISRAAERAAKLTSQLLVFSRKQVLAPRVINLNHILAEMSEPLGHMVGENIRLSIIPGEDLGNVRADPQQVEQAIMNMVVNANDAMPTGGKLTIRTANAELDAEFIDKHPGASPGQHVMLAVSDTGTGMDTETRSKVFEPFFTTKPVGEGTGLGLSTVYGYVKQSGGYTEVQSDPEQGATFKIYLRRIEAPVEVGPQALATALRSEGKETILLVEDEEPVRQLIARVLRERGYTVLEAGRASEALPLGERYQGRIDMLITDVVMPQMSGPELARRLTEARPRMPVLYISGYAKDAPHQHNVAKPDGVLAKPFSPDVLAGTVRRILDEAQKAPGREA